LGPQKGKPRVGGPKHKQEDGPPFPRKKQKTVQSNKQGTTGFRRRGNLYSTRVQGKPTLQQRLKKRGKKALKTGGGGKRWPVPKPKETTSTDQRWKQLTSSKKQKSNRCWGRRRNQGAGKKGRELCGKEGKTTEISKRTPQNTNGGGEKKGGEERIFFCLEKKKQGAKGSHKTERPTGEKDIHKYKKPVLGRKWKNPADKLCKGEGGLGEKERESTKRSRKEGGNLLCTWVTGFLEHGSREPLHASADGKHEFAKAWAVGGVQKKGKGKPKGDQKRRQKKGFEHGGPGGK